jgi:putative addiction module CopG family antidote
MDLKGLPSELEQFVEQEISEGTYQSAEEVVSAALRLLQAHKAKGNHASLSPNGQSRTVPRSAEEVVQAIRDALATGHYDAAHQLAMEGAKHYPQHDALQQYAHILAPPAVRNVPSSSESRAAVKANGEWLKAHRQDYLGRWVALRAGELVRVDDSYEALVADLDTTNLLLTKIV